MSYIYKVLIAIKEKYCRCNYNNNLLNNFSWNRIFSETYFHGKYFARNVGILLGYVTVQCFEQIRFQQNTFLNFN